MSKDTVIGLLQEKGYTREQAMGIAANIKQESNFNPSAVGDGGKAYGIGQWHPDRQAQFQKAFGKPIQGSSLKDQVDFIDYELKNNEKGAGQKLANAKTAGEAAAIISMHYERPADRAGEATRRAAMAASFAGESPTATTATASMGQAPGKLDALAQLRQQGWSADIDFALSKGFTPNEIVTKISNHQPAQVDDTAARKQVGVIAAKGGNPVEQMASLRGAGWKADIDYALSKGFTPQEIVDKIAGHESQAGTEAFRKADAQNPIVAGLTGAGNNLADQGRALSRVYSRATGDELALAQKQAAQDAANNDLGRIAENNLPSGKIGNTIGAIAPELALTAATGGLGAGLPMAARLAAQGALGGALSGATQADDQNFLSNVGAGALAGGVTGGGAGMVAGVPMAAGRVLQKSLRGGESVETLAARRVAMMDEGINPSAAELSQRAANYANQTGKNVTGSSWFGADQRMARTPDEQAMIGYLGGAKPAPESGGMSIGQMLNLGAGLKTGGSSMVGSGLAGQLAMRVLTDPKRAAMALGLNQAETSALQNVAASMMAGGTGGETANMGQHRLDYDPKMVAAQIALMQE